MKEITCLTGSDDLSSIHVDEKDVCSDEGSGKILKIGEDLYIRITYGDGWETQVIAVSDPEVVVAEFYDHETEQKVWKRIRSQAKKGEVKVNLAKEVAKDRKIHEEEYG